MRRTSASLAIAVLLLTLNPSPANAASKPGSPCKQINESTISGKSKLFCLKSGNSQIWIKQSDLTSYAFGPASRLVYRYVGGKQERLSARNQWLKQDYRDEKSFNAIRVAAYNSIRNLKTDSSYENIEFELITRPSYPKELANAITLQSKEFAKRLSPMLSKKLVIKLVLVTEKDKKYIDTELPRLIPKEDWQGALSNIAFYDTIQRFYSRGGTGGGTASYLPQQGFAYYIGHTSSLAKLNTYWPEIAPHEMAHVMQGVLANGFGGEYGEGDPRGKWHGHFIEGSANTFGMAFGFDQLGWYSDEMDRLLKSSISYNKGKYPMKNLQDAIFLINEIEKRDNEVRSDFSYSAGQFVWEYFVGKYGAEKYIELLRNVQETDNFSENLQKTIQTSKDDFYRGAAEYLLASWKRLS
jgi:hypothetical protein